MKFDKTPVQPNTEQHRDTFGSGDLRALYIAMDRTSRGPLPHSKLRIAD
jgi:hypothetical protein